MKLAYAFLAKDAETSEAGMHIFGADFTRITAATAPAAISFAIIAKFVMEGEADADIPHIFKIDIKHPGNDWVASSERDINDLLRTVPGNPVVSVGVITKYEISPVAIGTYEFRLCLDNAEVAVLPLEVKLQAV